MRVIKNTLPSQGFLQQCLDYDPSTGVLRWKTRPKETFKVEGIMSLQHRTNKWNARYAGKEAFTWRSPRYFVGAIGGVSTLAHRVIWKLSTGVDPKDIDHIDGDGFNNRLLNLRSVETSENMRNTKGRKSSPSGHLGVQWFSRTNKWRARIQSPDGKEIHLGYFEDIEDAISVRKIYETRLGYHLNHGRLTT